MRKTRLVAGIGLATAALLLTACNSGSPTSSGDTDTDTGTDTGTDTSSDALFEVAADVSLTGSPTFDTIKERGNVVVGVKEDQPNLGYLDPTTNERIGFDIDIARWVAASLGYAEDDIEFEAIPSANREQALINGDIDYYVGTYSITDKRKEQISFAGPYFLSGQGLLVSADNTDINGPDDLAGKTVCSATGSTPLKKIQEDYPEAKTAEFDTYSQCVEQLKAGQVDAVTTDEAILIGYAALEPDKLKVVGEVFSEERYGIGIPKGDTALQEFINKMLTDGGDIWDAIYDKNLGSSGVTGEQPAVDPVE